MPTAAAPKRKRCKPKPAAGQRGQAAGATFRRELLKEIIYRSVRGEVSPWPIDPDFKPGSTFAAAFKRGDKQQLLWAIDYYAQKGRPIPKWAAQALHDILYRTVAGEAASWDDAFGRLYARGTQRRRIHGLSRMVDVWHRVRELNRQGHAADEGLFEKVSAELGIGRGRVRDYYWSVQGFVRRVAWPDS